MTIINVNLDTATHVVALRNSNEEMREAGHVYTRLPDPCAREVYDAMIAAAPPFTSLPNADLDLIEQIFSDMVIDGSVHPVKFAKAIAALKRLKGGGCMSKATVKSLPTPRLQLRWEACQIRDCNWQCHYELVIELKEHDIRREIYKNGRQLKRKLPRQLTIKMKDPQLRQSSTVPCTVLNTGERYADDPYRDGMHARWDAEQLKLPVYIIAPDGMTFLIENKT